MTDAGIPTTIINFIESTRYAVAMFSTDQGEPYTLPVIGWATLELHVDGDFPVTKVAAMVHDGFGGLSAVYHYRDNFVRLVFREYELYDVAARRLECKQRLAEIRLAPTPQVAEKKDYSGSN